MQSSDEEREHTQNNEHQRRSDSNKAYKVELGRSCDQNGPNEGTHTVTVLIPRTGARSVERQRNSWYDVFKWK